MRNLSDGIYGHVFLRPAFLTIFDRRSYFVHYLYDATRDGKSTRPRTRTKLGVRSFDAKCAGRGAPRTTTEHRLRNVRSYSMRVGRSSRPLQMLGYPSAGFIRKAGEGRGCDFGGNYSNLLIDFRLL
jgi:hypothetical protein